jgi:thiol-disulfide isomerase/thioredoxin
MNKLFRRGSSQSGNERNCVFLNRTGGPGSPGMRFANVSAVSGLDFPDDGRCVVVVDWDHDGDLDLLLRSRTAPKLRLMINRSTSGADANSFVAFKLIGTTCNRDAIGARVEVELTNEAAGRLIQTLRAGDGYLSQSSKWLHFGLAAGTKIKGITVRWPGGQQEQFGAVAGGQCYELRQGSGEAQPTSTEKRSVRLAASVQPRANTSSAAQILLPRRVPLPNLSYLSMDGKQEQALREISRTTLVMLWDSTCPHCRGELTSLAASKTELDAAGLDLLALNVDQLSAEGAADSSEAQKFLDGISFPYRTGRATGPLLHKIQHLIGALFDSEVSFAVPLGLLIDGDGNLLAIYRGPPPRNILLFDARHADADDQPRRDMAAPFAGRWYTQHPPRPVLLELLADHFQQDDPGEAAAYLEMALPDVKNAAAKQSLQQRIATLYYYAASRQVAANDFAGAEQSLARVVELQPQNRQASQQLEDVRARLRLRDEK